MAHINTTGNSDIDQATAEIAVALRAEHPGSNDEYCYRQAERLRDRIMAGTRELDRPRSLTTAEIYAQADDAVRRIERRSADQLGEDQVS